MSRMTGGCGSDRSLAERNPGILVAFDPGYTGFQYTVPNQTAAAVQGSQLETVEEAEGQPLAADAARPETVAVETAAGPAAPAAPDGERKPGAGAPLARLDMEWGSDRPFQARRNSSESRPSHHASLEGHRTPDICGQQGGRIHGIYGGRVVVPVSGNHV
jgi:hypothetical protein